MEDRDQRQVFMQAVLDRGYARGYQGVRIAKSGRRFWIEDATVWNLTDSDGVRHGQAAMIPRWSTGPLPGRGAGPQVFEELRPAKRTKFPQAPTVSATG
jgi:hypothetical protein